ncbi:Longitudinals lacking protein-like [Orchesella cincta]|uniref:Longitudinals lacking protein-like n=1 Tax=Orchesella cincta TaxID=48709 RepID=A0A1D2M7G5_ORCCI|nr:Longitudinals lacking protein-like [Orchesella cincta]
MSNGQVIRCHRLVLSAFSPYLAQIISDQPAADIVINFQEIEFRELEALDFMYHGDVTVSCDKVELFARAADKLKIVGLAGTIGTHIADLLHREGIVGNPGLESSSELHQQQEKSQNVQKKCKMPNASTTEQQQGKRNADLDPAQGTFKRLMGCPEITLQNQKRPRVTATGSESTIVKIPPAATKTSQSTSGSATVVHFSRGGTCIPAGIQDKGLDLSAKNPNATAIKLERRRVSFLDLRLKRWSHQFPHLNRWRKLQGMAGKQTVMTARLVPNMEFV